MTMLKAHHCPGCTGRAAVLPQVQCFTMRSVFCQGNSLCPSVSCHLFARSHCVLPDFCHLLMEIPVLLLQLSNLSENIIGFVDLGIFLFLDWHVTITAGQVTGGRRLTAHLLSVFAWILSIKITLWSPFGSFRSRAWHLGPQEENRAEKRYYTGIRQARGSRMAVNTAKKMIRNPTHRL